MEIIKPDKELLKKEKLEDKKKEAESIARKEYFEQLRNDVRFQKFVVEEIIEANLNILTDVRNIQEKHLEEGFEEMGKAMFASMRARGILEKILSQLLKG